MQDKVQPFMLPLSAAQSPVSSPRRRTALNPLACAFCSPLPPATSCRDWPRSTRASNGADIVIDSRPRSRRVLAVASGPCPVGVTEVARKVNLKPPSVARHLKTESSSGVLGTKPGIQLLARAALALVNGAPELGRGWSGPAVELLQPGQKGKAALRYPGQRRDHVRACSRRATKGRQATGWTPYPTDPGSPAGPQPPARGSDARGLPGRAVPCFSPARVLRGSRQDAPPTAVARDRKEEVWVPAGWSRAAAHLRLLSLRCPHPIGCQ